MKEELKESEQRFKESNELFKQAKFQEVEKSYYDVIRKREEILGPDHPHTLSAKTNYGLTLNCLKRYKEAA